MSLLSRIGTKDGAPIWAGALPKGRHGLSMSALGTDPISPSRTGCRCRNRRRWNDGCCEVFENIMQNVQL